MSDETVYKAQVKEKEGSLPRLALILIGAGLLFLATNLLPFTVVDIIWPLFVIGPGLLLLMPAYKSTPEAPQSLAFLAVPGAFLVGLGLMLATMSLTDHWESWAYAWTLLPVAALGGALYMKRHQPESSVHERGHQIVRALVIAFMGLAMFFELFIFPGRGEWWPVLLIGAGIYLFVKQRS
jgi:hypothetical protein